MKDRKRRIEIRSIYRVAIFLFFLASLLYSQAAAHLHALSDAAYNLAKVESGGKNLPRPHPIEKCLAFHAVGSAITGFTLAFDPPPLDSEPVIQVQLPVPRAPRVAFDSRAPPVLS